MTEKSSDTYIILSADLKKIPFGDSFKKHSKLIKEILEDEDEDEDDLEQIIPLDYNSNQIKKCIEFCKIYDLEPFIIDEEPMKINDISNYVPKWAVEFIDIEVKEIFKLMCIANFLDINQLINLTCIKISSMIKGKNPEEIKKYFEIDKPSKTSETPELFIQSCSLKKQNEI
jgi:S-phase kinase-associated protein 1